MIGVILPPLSRCFSLNNSKTVKAVNLVFFSTEQLFVRDIHAKFGFLHLLQWQNCSLASEFLVKFFINKSFLISRTTNDIDKKFGPLTKLDRSNTKVSKTKNKIKKKTKTKNKQTKKRKEWCRTNSEQSGSQILDA